MRYIKQFMQKTVREENAEVFDLKMNKIYEQASTSGKMPEVHYHDGDCLCATIRFWFEDQIPETLSDEYELIGDIHHCYECPYFTMPNDKRIRYIKCERSGARTAASDKACDIFYMMLKEKDHEGIK